VFTQTVALVRRIRRSAVVIVTAVAATAASTLAYADGIDVSHWQGSIAWSQVENAGVQFAFMKATEGTGYTDTMLAKNWAATKQVGIYRGAYHFARPSVGSAPAQARYFVSKVGSFKEAGVLPPVLDLEATGGLSPSQLRTWVSTWLTTVEDLTGRTPILYFSPSFWEVNLGNSTAFSRYPLWVAHYTSAPGPGRLEHLDVLAAHQQRPGQRHRRQRRHEPLQRLVGAAREARLDLGRDDRPRAAGPHGSGGGADHAHAEGRQGHRHRQRAGDVHR
jgi:GH25 family lysozyme M1 (1,4-beta-N-acetylmuramidase)